MICIFSFAARWLLPTFAPRTVKKLMTIARTIAVLMLAAVWLAVSTASLIHDALHHGVAGHGAASHGDGFRPTSAASSTVVALDATDAHAATIAACFFCINGPLLLLLSVVAPLVLLLHSFRYRHSRCSWAIAYHRFLLPPLRAPPQFG